MKPLKILVPVDFTASSKAALQAATVLVRASRGRLLIVHAYEPQHLLNRGSALRVDADQEEDRLVERLNSLVPATADIVYDPCVTKGSPVEVILKTAKQENVDMIVLGTHGRRAHDDVLMGNVAECVLRRATCPVMAVRAGTQLNTLAAESASSE